MARLTISDKALDAKVRAWPGTQRKLRRVADAVRDEAAKNAFTRIPSISIAGEIRVVTGPGRGFTVRSTRGLSRRRGRQMPVATPRWQHDGTGIYGPRRRPITPKNGPYLRFFWPKQNRWVTTKSVRGTRPTRYMTDAAATVAARTRGLRYRPRN